MANFQVFNSRGELTLDDDYFTVHGVEVIHTDPDYGWKDYAIDDTFVAVGFYGNTLDGGIRRWEKYRSTIRVRAPHGEKIILFYAKPPPASVTRQGYGLEIYNASGQVVASSNAVQFEVKQIIPVDYRNGCMYPFSVGYNQIFCLINSQVFWERQPSGYNASRHNELFKLNGQGYVGWSPIIDLNQNRNFFFSVNNPTHRCTLLVLQAR